MVVVSSSNDNNNTQLNSNNQRRNRKYPCTHIIQKYIPKLILEVFGGTGAIWGFSEAIGLRTSHTVWFWRPFSLCVGILFLMRWFKQIKKDYYEGYGYDTYDHEAADTIPAAAAGIHWTVAILGLLRMVAFSRLLHFIYIVPKTI